jgi:hypothetical protein
MFCPNCKAEYREGFYRCAYCDVDLVSSLPEEQRPSDEEIVTAFRTTDMVLLSVVKSLLDSSGIEYAVQGEEGPRILPMGLSRGFFNPKAIGAVVLVRQQDRAEVEELLKTVEREEEYID